MIGTERLWMWFWGRLVRISIAKPASPDKHGWKKIGGWSDQQPVQPHYRFPYSHRPSVEDRLSHLRTLSRLGDSQERGGTTVRIGSG